MGIQHVDDVTLIRHAYARPTRQGEGVGECLLSYLCRQTEGLGEEDRLFLYVALQAMRHTNLLIDAPPIPEPSRGVSLPLWRNHVSRPACVSTASSLRSSMTAHLAVSTLQSGPRSGGSSLSAPDHGGIRGKVKSTALLPPWRFDARAGLCDNVWGWGRDRFS